MKTIVCNTGAMDFDANYGSEHPEQPLSWSNKTATAPITNFYSGKSVFITGGTGFLGTILIGKLITTCPVKCVYMLMKSRDNTSIQERLKDFINSPVFDEVKKNDANALNKIVPISGNIREKQLGISDEDMALLCAEVHVVFHIAANINLDSDLKDTLEVNTMATAELVQCCKGMPHLRVFLYVSTAYSNCQRRFIDEKVYEPEATAETIYDISKKICNIEKNVDRLKINLMGNRPNAYSFSKSLAEKIVEEGFNGIPSVIVRPSIITSSIKYPEPGWTNSWSAPNRLVLGVADGFMRCMYADPNILLDIVPVDQVANLMIASVWDASKRTEKVKVFNCCSGLMNPITLGNYMHSGDRYIRKYSWMATFTRFLFIVKQRAVFNILWFIFQTIPASIMDTLSWLLGKTPRMMRINRSVLRAQTVSTHFVFTEFTFADHNTTQLLKDMDPVEQRLFDFDFSIINWEEYLEAYVFGLQKFLIRK